jgi:hypothetical protein
MNILFTIFGLVWDVLKWILLGFAISIAPILVISFVIMSWEVIIKKKKIPKKRKVDNPKYSKTGLFYLLKKVYVDSPVRLVTDRLSLDPDRFDFYGVHIFAGPQGSGKSIAAMHLIKLLKEKYPLVKVRSNISINFQDGEINDWTDLLNTNNGIYGLINFIDELQNWFSSLDSKGFPPEMLTEITQQRKQANCIIGTSQVFERLAKQIREQITLLYKPLTIAGCFTVVRVYDVSIDNSGQVDKMRMRRLYCFVHDKELRECYDTYKKVERLSVNGFLPRSEHLSSINTDKSNIIINNKVLKK